MTKTLENIYEGIIIVLGIVILVIPEIAYSLVLRGRDWVIDIVEEIFA